MSEELIRELRDQLKSARDESAERRKANKDLKADVARLTAELTSAGQKVTDLEGKVGKTPPELQGRIDDLTGQLRTLKHRGAFKELALAEGMRPNAIDTAWTALGLKAEADEPDAEALKAAIATAKESHDFLFGAPAADKGNDPPPAPKPPIGGDRGGRPPVGSFKVTVAQQSDPQWCFENQQAMADARAAGTLQIVPG